MRHYPTTLALAGAAAYTSLCTLSSTSPSSVTCQVNATSKPPSSPHRVVPIEPTQATAVSISQLRRWLEKLGADISAIDILPTRNIDGIIDDTPFGVFANVEGSRRTTRGLWGRFKASFGFDRGEVILAAFPLDAALTSAHVVQAPGQGPILQELLESGAIDDRTAVMLHLVVEKVREKESSLRFWLPLLPKHFSTPLFWKDDELAWLRGTTLHIATEAKKRSLESIWRRVEPAVRQMAVACNVDTKPTFEDFLWAYSLFWSRAIALPDEGDHSSTKATVDGLVPGLDFVNHNRKGRCRWTVAHPASVSAEQAISEPRDGAVCLSCPRGARLRPGTEININYGDRSNEELLFLYGFVEENNPDDSLMVACPLPPPSEWDEMLHARVQLLRARGTAPQLFLPAQHFQRCTGQGSCGRGWGKIRFHGSRRAAELRRATCNDEVQEMDLPDGVMRTLEVFVMERKHVHEELKALTEGPEHVGISNSTDTPSETKVTMDVLERSGLRLAVLTTLVRLLELKLRELEEGTGSLEGDEQLVEQAFSSLGPRQRDALIYRMGQKRLARDYLVYTNELLQQEMRHLQQQAEQNTVV